MPPVFILFAWSFEVALMKKHIALALLLTVIGTQAAQALTFEGTVEKADVVKKKQGFWQRLFHKRETPEGHIGVRISTHGKIAYVHPGSPAERAGLQTDDSVITVDGKKHNVENISGDPGTVVHLEVRRRTEQFGVDVARVDVRDIVD